MTFDDYDVYGSSRWIVTANGFVNTSVTDARGSKRRAPITPSRETQARPKATRAVDVTGSSAPLRRAAEVPNSATLFGGGKPVYNCLAWGLGVSGHWIQPCGDASPDTVPPKFGCKEIDCDAKVPCDQTKVMIFEDSKNPNDWHVMKHQCVKGWSSKNGQAPLYTGIAISGGNTGPGAAELFYNEYYKPKSTSDIKCWDCPSDPGPMKAKPCY